MPGYERVRIVGFSEHDLDEFICAICLGMFVNPVVTECCRQTYCSECIMDWVSSHNTCPNDRKTMDKKSLSPVPRIMENLLQNIRIKCSFESEGCPQVVTIGQLSQHINVCQFRPNQLCQTCGLIKESVLTHNCIQSLISEKQKYEEKCQNLSDKNDLLSAERHQKHETIEALKQELTQLKVDHQNCLDQLKTDSLRQINYLRAKYTRIYQQLKNYQAKEVKESNLSKDNILVDSHMEELVDTQQKYVSNEDLMQIFINNISTESLQSMKPLYIAKSWEELTKKAEDVNQRLTTTTTSVNVVRATDKLYIAAKEADNDCDEERAYIFFFRYFEVITNFKMSSIYKQNKELFRKVIGMTKFKEAANRIEQLTASLQNRYSSQSEDF